MKPSELCGDDSDQTDETRKRIQYMRDVKRSGAPTELVVAQKLSDCAVGKNPGHCNCMVLRSAVNDTAGTNRHALRCDVARPC